MTTLSHAVVAQLVVASLIFYLLRCTKLAEDGPEDEPPSFAVLLGAWLLIFVITSPIGLAWYCVEACLRAVAGGAR